MNGTTDRTVTLMASVEQHVTMHFRDHHHAVIAYHEAGHTVMAHLCGRAVRRVSIVGDEESAGRVEHSHPRGRWGLHHDGALNAHSGTASRVSS